MLNGTSLVAAIRHGLDEIADRWWNRLPVARIAINRRPVGGPWGGGNQWLDQIVRSLREHGYSVQFHLDRPVDCILLIDARNGPTVTFDAATVGEYKARHPHVGCIHRVNDNDRHRGSDFRDALQASGNLVADHTVFVSEWLRDYEAERWFDLRKPHSVIVNGADPRVFHPGGVAQLDPGMPLRLVTHHWSTNWNKGFATYVEIDRLIADGLLPNTELWVIGRWPPEIRWRAARTFSPRRGYPLAELLRQCHVYVTASQWESGPMHHIEAIQCGLPVIYHVNGGGIVEVARRFGSGFDGDITAAISEIRRRYAELRELVLCDPPSGERMCMEYRMLIERLIDARCRNAMAERRTVGSDC